MIGTMMDHPLLVSSLLWRAERVFGDVESVTCENGMAARRFSYRDLADRARRLAAALGDLGVVEGTRVGSLAWNTDRHLAAYFAVPGMGAVLHTINHRMPEDHIVYSIEVAQDEVLLVDADLLPVVEPILSRLPQVRHVVVLGDTDQTLHGVEQWSFDDIVAAAAPIAEFPQLDERQAASICFTSGTTGLPKGVAYSHRSTVLHALTLGSAGDIAIREGRSYLLATQMSHVNGWGVPFATALQGARIILPGAHPSTADFLRIATHENPHVLVGSPTVAAMMRDECLVHPDTYDLGSVDTFWLGGQAPPEALVNWWSEHGVASVNGWGMTETSPMGTFCHGHQSQGRPLPLFEMRIVDQITGEELPWDGRTPGELEVRSAWVTGTYLPTPEQDPLHDGWLTTGDVAVIHPDAQLQIKDRFKDLIKSGGEWISSVELEGHLMLHPDVVEAAVIAVPDDTWLERPLAWVRTTSPVTDEDLRAHVQSKFPKYWVPNEFVRVEEIPKTSVGKVDKAGMRRSQV
ncbi:MAG: AMP-binding protein [Aeromicrobium sp.]|uniref:AMP-binding protein n=1 Tax=Aeromicrobium sp. TaxID=1871063 RepID=UPI0026286110|nr:AMP-binding protein [Aeromicrobium sp.]MDF1704886.1 AMP-binding protein [Aeromicrobium sp.]